MILTILAIGLNIKTLHTYSRDVARIERRCVQRLYTCNVSMRATFLPKIIHKSINTQTDETKNKMFKMQYNTRNR